MGKNRVKQKPVGDVAPTGRLALSDRKRRIFRWLAGLGVPVFIVLGTELGLRLAGWGYPTGFFLRSETASPGIYQENSQFGWRFFPPRVARAPDPIRLTRTKPERTCRIFVFGESAALGDPEPAYGFSRILRELLEARCPGTRFEIVNVAMTAISSPAIARIARDCVPFQGDIWLVYMGNNEVVGPYGAGSVFGSQAPPWWLIQAGLALKSTRVGQLLDALRQRVLARGQEPARWEGMKMMLKEQVPADDPRLERVYDHFARNLEDILAMARRGGAKTIVCSMCSNLKDCPPFGSRNRPELSGERQAEWTRLLNAGAEKESRQEYAQALACYRQAATIDDTSAVLAFRIARCSAGLGEAAAARERYTRARDLDTLRFRADTRINAIIREVCARRAAAGVRWFDSAAAVTNACHLGIPGAECFWDHVHFNFRGNYLMARALADQVLSLVPESVRRQAETHPQVLTEAECAERLAWTDWDQRSVLQEMLRRVREAPFTAQLDHAQRVADWGRRLGDSQRATSPEGLAQAIEVYRRALARRSDDWRLHYRLGFLLEAVGDLPQAEQHWKEVARLVPQHVDAWFKLGDACVGQYQFEEAAQCYRRVLQLRPTSFEAVNGLGLVLMSEGKLDEAIPMFERALRMEPKFAQAHINWGLALAHRGMTVEALEHYREALRQDPESVGAAVNLGNLLAAQGNHSEAIAHYLQALQLRPEQATIHLSLANSLAAVGRGAEALEHYRAAVKLNPALAEAQFNLGVLLAKQGDLQGATLCFQEAARLSPQDPQAHLNLGVALAQQQRLPEAIRQFETVLRLDPANVAATKFLRAAAARVQPGR